MCFGVAGIIVERCEFGDRSYLMLVLPSLPFQESTISNLGTERIGHLISDPRQKE